MLLRTDEKVNWRSGSVIPKDDYFVILIDDISRLFTGDDTAKDTFHSHIQRLYRLSVNQKLSCAGT